MAAAFLGALMNWNFVMAGAASTNDALVTLAVLLILAWKVAGHIGLDYYLVRWLGTPWRNGLESDGDSPGAYAGLAT
jgi:thiosulfate dehydrogenase [quinone] large subunit